MKIPRFTAEASLYPQVLGYSSSTSIKGPRDESVVPQFFVSWNVHCTEAGACYIVDRFGNMHWITNSNF